MGQDESSEQRLEDRKQGGNLHCYNVIKDGDCETTPIHWVKVDEWKKVLEDVSLFFLCRVLSWI